MEHGKAEMVWAVASHVMALLANVNRDPKKTQPFKPKDFNPLIKPQKMDAKEGLRLFRAQMEAAEKVRRTPPPS